MNEESPQGNQEGATPKTQPIDLILFGVIGLVLLAALIYLGSHFFVTGARAQQENANDAGVENIIGDESNADKKELLLTKEEMLKADEQTLENARKQLAEQMKLLEEVRAARKANNKIDEENEEKLKQVENYLEEVRAEDAVSKDIHSEMKRQNTALVKEAAAKGYLGGISKVTFKDDQGVIEISLIEGALQALKKPIIIKRKQDVIGRATVTSVKDNVATAKVNIYIKDLGLKAGDQCFLIQP